MTNIREATTKVCIEEQKRTARLFLTACGYRAAGFPERAAECQEHAAMHHNEMWLRLSRLIGVS